VAGAGLRLLAKEALGFREDASNPGHTASRNATDALKGVEPTEGFRGASERPDFE